MPEYLSAQKVHLLRCAVPFVIATYPKVRLTLQDLRASNLELFSKSSQFCECSGKSLGW